VQRSEESWTILLTSEVTWSEYRDDTQLARQAAREELGVLSSLRPDADFDLVG
jgi:hypothetical protein